MKELCHEPEGCRRCICIANCRRHQLCERRVVPSAAGITIGDAFDNAMRQWHDRTALVVRHQGIRWNYRDLARQVDAFAAGLLSYGLRPGDRIGIWSPNCAEWVVTQFATAKAGLILVNINPAYRVGGTGIRAAKGWMPRADHGDILQVERLSRHAGQHRTGVPSRDARSICISRLAGAAHGVPNRRCRSILARSLSRRYRGAVLRKVRTCSRRTPGSCNATRRSISSSPAARPDCPKERH